MTQIFSVSPQELLSEALREQRVYQQWLQDPMFQKEYRSTRQSILERTITRLVSLTSKALDQLEKNLDCGKPVAENKAWDPGKDRAFLQLDFWQLLRKEVAKNHPLIQRQAIISTRATLPTSSRSHTMARET